MAAPKSEQQTLVVGVTWGENCRFIVKEEQQRLSQRETHLLAARLKLAHVF